MSVVKAPTSEIQVTSQVTYLPGESQPEQGYFLFSYRITIENRGNQSCQLMSRQWLIQDGHGKTEEVRGPGVVGLQPKIQAGQKFEYESACPLHTPWGTMKGFYQFISESGDSFQVEIPEFYLISPNSLH